MRWLFQGLLVLIGLRLIWVYKVGQQNMQRIENKQLNLRTRIKRLVRKTICFSKTTLMHDVVIGLFINRYEFGGAV